MTKKLTLLSILISTFLLTSCGKNIMSSDLFTKEQQSTSGSSSMQGYWKSQSFEIETEGEINQNIYLQDSITISKSDRATFDQQLKTHQCSQVKELESVKSMSVEIHLFVQYEQYYMIADVIYTTDDDQQLKCPGVLGQGSYYEEGKDYLYLEDIELGINLELQNSGKIAIRFLR